MHPRLQPTAQKNVSVRLFLRFFLLYFGGCLPASCLALRHLLPGALENLGQTELVFLLLALLGAVLTLSRPYLIALTLLKAFFDVAFLFALSRTQILRSNGFWCFNAALLYVMLSLLLYCLAAARACMFSFETVERDAALLFSRRFFCFFGEAALLSALGLTLFFLWPYLENLLG